MFVPVNCTSCAKPFQVPEAALGKPAACPWCQNVVTALPVAASVPASTLPVDTGGSPDSLATTSATPQAAELPPQPVYSLPVSPPEPQSLDETSAKPRARKIRTIPVSPPRPRFRL